MCVFKGVTSLQGQVKVIGGRVADGRPKRVLFLGEESWLLVPFEGVDGSLSAEWGPFDFENVWL